MRVVYAFPVNLSETGGKGRATAQKIEALKRISSHVDIYSLCFSVRVPLIEEFLIDIRAAWRISFSQPEFFVCRGGMPFFSFLACKIFNTKILREVHSLGFEEVKYLKKSPFIKILIYFSSFLSLFFDKFSDRRVFNNPLLKKKYIDLGIGKTTDVVVYNGTILDKQKSIPSRERVYSKYGLTESVTYLGFTGSASKWHGIGHLVELQKQLIDNGSNVQIVCVGGAIDHDDDPDSLLVNITPADETVCDEVLNVCDLALLPVASIRSSPGSPLKLYDYMFNAVPVVGQRDMPGYSDEIEKYGIGFCVDYANPKESVKTILKELDNTSALDTYKRNARLNISKVSWESRLADWFKEI